MNSDPLLKDGVWGFLLARCEIGTLTGKYQTPDGFGISLTSQNIEAHLKALKIPLDIPLPKVQPAPGVVEIAKAKKEERRLRSLSIWKVWLLRHGVGVKASVNATLSTPPTPL